ncbi:hypothetical protein ABFA25_01685 [Mycobacterium lepromatosis]|nr:hypothetical protein [Mycobacterium lepromatosis]
MISGQLVESQNQYSEDFLAPVSTEVTAIDLEVAGCIPEHLDGRSYVTDLMRSLRSIRRRIIGLPVDGMVHEVALCDGKAC